MKKLNYLLLGAAGLLLASCSQEELVTPAPAGDGNFNVTVSLPGTYASRTMNDGYTATDLYVGVFDADNDNAFVYQVPSDGFEGDQLSTQVSMNLATGKTYTIAFFAYAPGAFSSEGESALYSLDEETGVMTVNYSMMDQDGIDDDTYDCFFNVINTGKISNKAETVNVTLTRPLAQVNWGTDDANAEAVKNENAYGAGLKNLQAELTTSAYNQFSFLTGDVTGEEVPVTLNGFAVPEGTSYPVNPTTYTYVAMQYLLAPVATSATYDLTLNVDNSGNPSASQLSNEIVVASAPVQANYQTNIYGTLLSDKYNFNVTKSPGWAGDFKLPQEMGDQVTGTDGQLVDGLYLNSETKTYTITSPTGLEYYAKNIAGDNQTAGQDQYTMSGYLTVLGADLDMQGVDHTPFSAGNGTFDGQGHTIKNLTVNVPSTATSENYAGFMTRAIGTVQNINFQDAKITGNAWAGVLAGDGIAAVVNNVNAYNCTVTSTAYQNSEGEYEAGNSVGAIIGYLSGQNSASVTNCIVDGCTITGCRDVGGVVGRAQAATVENNSVTNTTVTANQQLKEGTYSETSKGLYAGAVVGNLLNDPIVQNNTTKDVSVTTISSTGEVTASVASQAALQAAVNNDNATITLQPGSYTFPSKPGSGVVITGTTDVKIQEANLTDNYPVSGYNNVTFKGITINNPTNKGYSGVQGNDITFDSCVIDGVAFGYGDKWTYTNCTFNQTQDEYCIWAYTANNLVLEGCTFNCYNKGVLLYNEGGLTAETVTITNCKFKASDPEEGKAAIMVNNCPCTFNLTISNCTEENFGLNAFSDSSLWGVKESPKATITLNGKEVYNN